MFRGYLCIGAIYTSSQGHGVPHTVCHTRYATLRTSIGVHGIMELYHWGFLLTIYREQVKRFCLCALQCVLATYASYASIQRSSSRDTTRTSSTILCCVYYCIQCSGHRTPLCFPAYSTRGCSRLGSRFVQIWPREAQQNCRCVEQGSVPLSTFIFGRGSFHT